MHSKYKDTPGKCQREQVEEKWVLVANYKDLTSNLNLQERGNQGSPKYWMLKEENERWYSFQKPV